MSVAGILSWRNNRESVLAHKLLILWPSPPVSNIIPWLCVSSHLCSEIIHRPSYRDTTVLCRWTMAPPAGQNDIKWHDDNVHKFACNTNLFISCCSTLAEKKLSLRDNKVHLIWFDLIRFDLIWSIVNKWKCCFMFLWGYFDLQYVSLFYLFCVVCLFEVVCHLFGVTLCLSGIVLHLMFVILFVLSCISNKKYEVTFWSSSEAHSPKAPWDPMRPLGQSLMGLFSDMSM